jgi:hypothetical protein
MCERKSMIKSEGEKKLGDRKKRKVDEVELELRKSNGVGGLSITRGFDREKHKREYIRYSSRTLGTVLVI